MARIILSVRCPPGDGPAPYVAQPQRNTKEAAVNFISVVLVDDNPHFLKLTEEDLRQYDRITTLTSSLQMVPP
jgi:hypothetical protein